MLLKALVLRGMKNTFKLKRMILTRSECSSEENDELSLRQVVEESETFQPHVNHHQQKQQKATAITKDK